MSRAVGRSLGGPSALEVDDLLAWANGLSRGNFDVANEIRRFIGRDVLVEEGINVAANDINHVAEDIRVLLKNVEGFGGCAGASVTSGCERGLAICDEIGKIFGVAAVTEDAFIADDDELDELPVTPRDNIADLALRAANSSLFIADKDTNNHLKAQSLACGPYVQQAAAVR
jgi:hypothetical protein